MASARMWSCGSPCTVGNTVAGKAILESNLALLSQTKYVSTLELNNSPPGCLSEEILTQALRKKCTWVLAPALFVGEELEVPTHF